MIIERILRKYIKIYIFYCINVELSNVLPLKKFGFITIYDSF